MGIAAAGFSIAWLGLPLGGLIAINTLEELKTGIKYISLLNKILLGLVILLSLNAIGMMWQLRIIVYLLFLAVALKEIPLEGSIAIVISSTFISVNTSSIWLILGVGFLVGISASALAIAQNPDYFALLRRIWYFLPLGFALLAARNLFI